MSEVEKGYKLPSNLLLHEIAQVFELGLKGEVDLFHRFDHIPLLTVEELEDQATTHYAFAKLRQLVSSGKITIEQRQEFYTEFDKLFHNFLARLPP